MPVVIQQGHVLLFRGQRYLTVTATNPDVLNEDRTMEMREGFGTLGFATSRSAAIAERSLFQALVKTNHLQSTYLNF